MLKTASLFSTEKYSRTHAVRPLLAYAVLVTSPPGASLKDVAMTDRDRLNEWPDDKLPRDNSAGLRRRIV